MSGSGVSVTVYPDPGDFLRAAGAFLRADPAEHNLILSIAESAESAAADGAVEAWRAPFLAAVMDRHRVVGAAFRTPPHKLGLTRMPAAATPVLAAAVARRYQALPAVFGPEEAADAFARAWGALRQVGWGAGEAHRIYRLDRVDAPRSVPGHLRRAGEGDADLLARWSAGFADDLGPQYRASPEARRIWLDEGGAWVWEDDGPVSMAVGLGFTTGGARVGYVYTPPEHRGRGYGTAVAAGVSQALLDGGRDFCVLYARRDDPVTNRMYRAMGYRPVADVVERVFEAAGGSAP